LGVKGSDSKISKLADESDCITYQEFVEKVDKEEKEWSLFLPSYSSQSLAEQGDAASAVAAFLHLPLLKVINNDLRKCHPDLFINFLKFRII